MRLICSRFCLDETNLEGADQMKRNSSVFLKNQ